MISERRNNEWVITRDGRVQYQEELALKGRVVGIQPFARQLAVIIDKGSQFMTPKGYHGDASPAPDPNHPRFAVPVSI